MSEPKLHKKWDCPCTRCQEWYRDTLAAQLSELERISDALGMKEGHSSVDHIVAMKAKMAAQRNALTAATERAEQLQAECERLRVALREVADCNVHSGLGNHCTCSQRERWAIAYRAIDAASAAAAKETPK